MTKYAKIINEDTKEVQVGLGDNVAFYQSLGMTEMDVEQAYNKNWYLVGYVPAKPEEEIKKEQRASLIAQLDSLDLKCIRALRAIQAGTSTEDDTARLAELEEQAEEIRKQLQLLNPVTEAE